MKGSVHFFRGIFRTKGEAERTGRICAEGFVRTWGTVETDAGHDPVSIVQFKGGTSHIHFKCLDRDDGTAVLGVFVSDHAKAGLSRVEGKDSVNELFRQREFMLESQIH